MTTDPTTPEGVAEIKKSAKKTKEFAKKCAALPRKTLMTNPQEK